MNFLRFCFPFFCIRWLMGYHILPADFVRYADDFRTYPMGFQPPAQMGGRMGEMDDTLSDGAFLRSHALLRNITILCN